MYSRVKAFAFEFAGLFEGVLLLSHQEILRFFVNTPLVKTAKLANKKIELEVSKGDTSLKTKIESETEKGESDGKK